MNPAQLDRDPARQFPGFRLDVDDRARLLVPVGELDAATAPLLSDAVDDLQAERVDDVTVELGRLTFICAAGLNSLLAISRRQRGVGHRLVLRNPPAHVLRVFRLGGVNDLLLGA